MFLPARGDPALRCGHGEPGGPHLPSLPAPAGGGAPSAHARTRPAVGLEESQVLHTIPLLYWVFFLLVILDTPNIILSAET